MRKKILKVSLAIAMIVSAGHYAYKAYEPYMNAYMNEKDYFITENVLALSEETNASSYCTGSSIWGWVESTDGQYETRTHICDSIDYECTEFFVRCFASGTGKLNGAPCNNYVIPVSKSGGSYVKCTNNHKSLSDLF